MKREVDILFCPQYTGQMRERKNKVSLQMRDECVEENDNMFTFNPSQIDDE